MKTCPVCKITQMTSLTSPMCAWCSGKVGSDEAVCLGCGRTLLEVSRYGHPAGLPCFKLGWGSRPVSAELAAREPEGTPAPPRPANPCPTCKGAHVAHDWESACPTCRCVTHPVSGTTASAAAPPRPSVIRTKVSCALCNDVFTDDITPGHVYICEGCRGAKTSGRIEVFDPPTIDQCIRVTKLESDDVLLLRLPRGATPEVIQDITTKLSASKIRCVVLAADVDVEVLRPSPTQETASE